MFVLLLLLMVSTNAWAITPKTGIWWNPNESGHGHVLEVSGLTLFVSVYADDESGTRSGISPRAAC